VRNSSLPSLSILCALRRCAGTERGVSAIEFALVLPILIFVTLGTVEIGLDLWVDATVETAAQRASRLGITTVQPAGKTLEQAVEANIKDTLTPWASRIQTLTIDVKSYPSYAAVGQPEPYTDVNNIGRYVQGDPFTDVNKNGVWDADQGVGGTGGYNDIVSYHISVTMPTFTGIPALVGISTLTFNRTFIVQNETVQ
jgi:Flp pilus assembly protein TadG